jgi:hypothetical protein
VLAQQANAKDPANPIDPKDPFAKITMEVDQISADPIADKVFAVPDGYHLVSVAEFLKAMTPAMAAAPADAAASSPVAQSSSQEAPKPANSN